MASSTKKSGGFKPSAPKAPAPPRVDPVENKVDGEAVTHLTVRALTNGFRRAGRAWSAQETTVSIEEFTAEQVEALLAEPQLVVVPSVGDPTAKAE